jgi:putative membrane protein
LKIINKASIKKTIIIIGILIIPLMYSYFYLKAFWDPYSRLENLPVAVVNEDEGAVINGTQRNLGNELKNKINDNKKLDFVFIDKKEAYDGLVNHKYYATITVPKDFTKDISTASEINKIPATIIYSPNEETNYLATQILNKAIADLTAEIKSNVTSEIVDELTDKLSEVPVKLDEINSGVNKLYIGTSSLASGTNTLMIGANDLNKNYLTFNNGLNSIKTAVKDINNGNKQLNSGITTALNGAKQLNMATKDLYQIDNAVIALSQGSEKLSVGTTQYVDGVNQLITENNDIAKKIQAYVTSNPDAMLDPNMSYVISLLSNPSTSEQVNILTSTGNTLKTSSNTVSSGLKLLSNNTQSLSKVNIGISDISKGLETLNNGSNSLLSGSEQLNNGVTSIINASSKISTGINSLSNGTVQINSGTIQLKDGLSQANSEITKGIEDTNIKLKATSGIGDFVKNSVSVEQKSMNPVPNYGTAFSSYFMSLSLWVGGLVIFMAIYLDADDKFKILSRKSDRKILRTFIYLLIGIVQAVLLAFVVQKTLDLNIANVGAYYVSCILVSLVFISIIQFFMINFKDAGKFIAILLLILQLTSCGGTFPMELVPSFFNKIYIFMPMTYSVNLFKETVSGGNMTFIMQNIYVLLAILFVFVSITIVTAKVKNNINRVEA